MRADREVTLPITHWVRNGQRHSDNVGNIDCQVS